MKHLVKNLKKNPKIDRIVNKKIFLSLSDQSNWFYRTMFISLGWLFAFLGLMILLSGSPWIYHDIFGGFPSLKSLLFAVCIFLSSSSLAVGAYLKSGKP